MTWTEEELRRMTPNDAERLDVFEIDEEVQRRYGISVDAISSRAPLYGWFVDRTSGHGFLHPNQSLYRTLGELLDAEGTPPADELAEARADARAAQDRANRAEAALREIVETMSAWGGSGKIDTALFTARHMIREIIKRHGVRHGGDQ